MACIDGSCARHWPAPCQSSDLRRTGGDLVQTPEGPAVKFLGECRLLPDDIWDLRYLAQR